jgi:glutathione synthase/RimK-type ligase-like ATP-grasp enzyme
MIAIQENRAGFTERWVDYCERQGLAYQRVDVFTPEGRDAASRSDAFFWHLSHESARDMLIALPWMSALASSGVRVFPAPEQLWHFDDKLAQALFFEQQGLPAPHTTPVFSARQAEQFLSETPFPVIGKLRRGSASSNVFLIRSQAEGRRLIRTAFGKGFSLYNTRSRYADLWRRATSVREKLTVLLKRVYRTFVPPDYARQLPREKGYFLFQSFVENDGSDVRVVVVGDRAVALRRQVREGDFRASGSGRLEYPDESLNPEYIRLAFEVTDRLGAVSMGMDFIESTSGDIQLIEMSYGFPAQNFLDGAGGTWNRALEFTREDIRLQDWMVEAVLAAPAAGRGRRN